uniref:15-oxoprostaglandin 13-reductase n=1 Tax=Ciona savignyi TaxID=51511 RepID=H2Z8U8_CIOSA
MIMHKLICFLRHYIDSNRYCSIMSVSLPSSMRKLVVQALTSNFRKAIEIQTVSLPVPTSGHVLVKNRYVGINASDVNFTAGKYAPGVSPPFDAGFEAVGEVVAVSDDLPASLVGKSVAHMSNGAFSEFQSVAGKKLFEIPNAEPEYLTCMVSGMTAKLALQECGHLKKTDKVVLVTAASGGTGQFAVQLAKLAGCHVIGTCSSSSKVDFLKSIGCDHAINVSTENLNQVLKESYPEGVDVVYESVGGDTYETCVNRLAVKGRLIVIGYISGYQKPMGVASGSASALPVKMLMKSSSVSGFFLFHYADQWRATFHELCGLYKDKKLSCTVADGSSERIGGFKGIDSIPDAVDFLYSRKSIGKIFVELNPQNTGNKL